MKFWQKKQGYDKSVWLEWLNDDAPSSKPNTNPPASNEGKPSGVDWSRNVRGRVAQVTPVRRVPRPDIRENIPTNTRPMSGRTSWQQVKPPQATGSVKKSASDQAKEIHINLTLPSLARIRHLWKLVQTRTHPAFKAVVTFIKNRKMYVGAITTAVVAVFVVVGIFSGDATTKQDGPKVAGTSKQVKPSYDPATPAGKDDSSIGLKYDPAKKVASYQDKIGLVEVTVSQQPLPDKFKKNPQSELKKLAESFAATTEIELDNGEKAYMGTSAKGPQTAIATYNDLLIFIIAQKEVTNTQWADYISALET